MTRGRARGFTLIELLLASVLGVAVVVSVWSVLALLRASEKRSAEQAEGLQQLVQLQRALGVSFRTLVMTDKPVRQPAGPGAKAADAAGAAGAKASAGGSGAIGGALGGAENAAMSRADQMRQTIESRRAAAAGVIEERRNSGREAREDSESGPPPPLPRLALDFDRERRLPRLEMVTTRPALAVEVPGGFHAFVSPEDNDGVRGAFEVEPGRRPGTYDIWYRAYASEDGGPDSGRKPLGEKRVASGLTKLNVIFHKTIEGRGLASLDFTDPESPVEAFDWSRPPGDFDVVGWGRTPAARHYNHLPAYVEVKVETWQGLRASWTFEVKWIITRAADAPAGAGKDRRAAGAGDKPGTGGSSGSGVQRLPDGRPVTELFGPDGRRR